MVNPSLNLSLQVQLWKSKEVYAQKINFFKLYVSVFMGLVETISSKVRRISFFDILVDPDIFNK